MKKSTILLSSLLAAGVGLLAGCSSSPNSSGTGELKVSLIDAPINAQAVNLVVTRVDAHINGADSLHGWVTLNDTSATYNLLTLVNGASAVLGDAKLPAGKYTQLRLMIGSGSTIMVNNVSYPLQIPSGLTTGLKLNNNFTIAENTLYELTLDFNADKSIKLTGSNQYTLDPVVRVEATVTSGVISGTVLPPAAKAVVSTVVGTDSVSTYADTTTGAFQLMALPAGAYTITISPRDTLYADTTITALALVAQQNLSLDTITLRSR